MRKRNTRQLGLGFEQLERRQLLSIASYIPFSGDVVEIESHSSWETTERSFTTKTQTNQWSFTKEVGEQTLTRSGSQMEEKTISSFQETEEHSGYSQKVGKNYTKTNSYHTREVSAGVKTVEKIQESGSSIVIVDPPGPRWTMTVSNFQKEMITTHHEEQHYRLEERTESSSYGTFYGPQFHESYKTREWEVEKTHSDRTIASEQRRFAQLEIQPNWNLVYSFSTWRNTSVNENTMTTTTSATYRSGNWAGNWSTGFWKETFFNQMTRQQQRELETARAERWQIIVNNGTITQRHNVFESRAIEGEYSFRNWNAHSKTDRYFNRLGSDIQRSSSWSESETGNHHYEKDWIHREEEKMTMESPVTKWSSLFLYPLMAL